MTSGKKKVSDSDIIGLNSVGISLGGIGKRLDCHHTTVTGRLKILGIEPADTRRSFMEDIYDGLTSNQQVWVINQLGGGRSIKDFVKSLIVKEFISKNP
jgi:ABC-type uncharacterized transport system ATPase subunit